MNIGNKNSASKSVFKFDDVFIEVHNLCKYLGIYVDSKLSFQSHIEYFKKKLSKQCGFICKLRHYIPRKKLIDYYRSNINPLISIAIAIDIRSAHFFFFPLPNLQEGETSFVPVTLALTLVLKDHLHYECSQCWWCVETESTLKPFFDHYILMTVV